MKTWIEMLQKKKISEMRKAFLRLRAKAARKPFAPINRKNAIYVVCE
jgi:hypothetical protein